MSDYQKIITKLTWYSAQGNNYGQIATSILKLQNNRLELHLKKIAYLANCSPSLVFKFIKQKLNLESFNELRYILLSQNTQITKKQETNQLLLKMQNCFKNINQLLTPYLKKQICNNLNTWHQIWIIGKSDTFTIAQDFAFKLKRLNILAHTIEAYSELELKQNLIAQEDGVIFISTSGETKELIQLQKYLNHLIIPSIIFTSNHNSPLAKQAKNLVINVPYEKSLANDILFTTKLYYLFAFDLILEQLINTPGKNLH